MDVATPQSVLYDKLLQLGWSLGKIAFKQGVYVGVAKNQTTGQEVTRTGKSPEMVVASMLRYAQKANEVRRYAALQKLAAWDSDWLDQKDEIAAAYAKMPAFDPKAAPAFQALAAESNVQATAIKGQITVEVTDEPDPYPNADAMREDIHKNHHFKVTRANADHPVWSKEDVINFRIVHDVLGYAQSGADFSWKGENLACGTHFPLVSPLAREALFTECIGQAAYKASSRGFGPQKVGLMSKFLHPVQDKHGEHVWVPHGGIPQLQSQDMAGQAQAQEGVFNSPGDWVTPAQPQVAPPSPVFGLGSPVMQGYKVMTKMVSPDRPHDPNAHWNPEQVTQPIDDPADDYIGMEDTLRNAAKIDTQWQHEDEATQKKAIMNAFRVALLSPRKHLKWNAAHYQALMNHDPGTKAVDLWNTLEEAREKHNQGLGYPEGSHLAYRKQLDFLAHKLQEDDPDLDTAKALKAAKEIVFKKIKEFEEQLASEGGEDDETSELRRYNQARRMVNEWMKENYSPLRGWQQGQMSLAAVDSPEACPNCHGEITMSDGVPFCNACGWRADRPNKEYSVEDWTPDIHSQPNYEVWKQRPDVEPNNWLYSKTADDQTLFATQPDDEWAPVTQDASGFASGDSKYGAFMGGHLDAIEAVGKHIDQIWEAAKKDLDDGGKGFHFRNTVMNMNLPGVNPKVASFAWLLLNPLGSELGIVDTHILRGLRRNEKDATPRDYYKLERMERAAKDATGYAHMPLGAYHWGLWDAIRNPGEHSDHSPLRILDPLPWDSPDAKWDSATNSKSGPWTGPIQFENARGLIERAARDFDAEVGSQPRGIVPLTRGPGGATAPSQSTYTVPAL